MERRTGHHARRGFAAAALALSLVASGCSAKWPLPTGTPSAPVDKPTLVYGVVSGSTSQEPRYAPLLKMLSKETGKEVKLQEFKKNSDLADAISAGKVDIATYPTAAYIGAKATGTPMDVAAAGVSVKGQPAGLSTGLWVPKDSSIKSLTDLKGKKLCIGYQSEVHGTLAPMGEMSKAGLVKQDVTQVPAAGKQVETLMGGGCDAFFGADWVINQAVSTKAIEKDQLVRVWKSDLVPYFVLVLNRNSLTSSTSGALRRAIVEKSTPDALKSGGYCTDKGCALPGDAPYGYVAIDEKALTAVYQGCEFSGFAVCKQK